MFTTLNPDEFRFEFRGKASHLLSGGTIELDRERHQYRATIIAQSDPEIRFDAWDDDPAIASLLCLAKWMGRDLSVSGATGKHPIADGIRATLRLVRERGGTPGEIRMHPTMLDRLIAENSYRLDDRSKATFEGLPILEDPKADPERVYIMEPTTLTSTLDVERSTLDVSLSS